MGRSRTRPNKARARRDATDIANRRLPRTDIIDPYLSPSPLKSDLRAFEDRRQWYPGTRPAASPRSREHLLEVFPNVNRKIERPVKRRLYGSAQITFSDVDTLVCVRRGRRKEVLHALGKAGRRGQKRPRFNSMSKVSCKKRR